MGAPNLNIRNLAFIRQIPGFGAKLYEAIADIRSGVNTISAQGNLNPNGGVATPPNVQKVTATGQNGVLHVSIQDQSAGINRDLQYVVEHADNPSFNNAQQRFIGATRSFNEFIGNDTRYVRAYSTYGASSNSSPVYHGTPSTPTPVNGGGGIGPPAYLPSQGAGTGAPGQSGYGQGPVQARDQSNSFDWTLQQPRGATGSQSGSITPAGAGALAGGGSGGGGGGSVSISEGTIAPCETLASVTGTNTIAAVTAVPYSALTAGFKVRLVPANTNTGAVTLNVNSIGGKAVTKNGTTALVGGELQAGREYDLNYDGTQFQILGPSLPISALVVGSDASGNPKAAALAKGNIFVGNGSSLPVAVGPGTDGQVLTANSGATNGLDYEAPIALTTTGTSGAATLTPGNPYSLNIPNYSGSGSVSSWTPAVSFGGASVGVTYSSNTGHYYQVGTLIVATFDITLSSKGGSTGIAEITGLPSAPSASEVTGGDVQYAISMASLTSTPTILPEVGATKASLWEWGATGSANLTDANFTNTTRMIATLIYSA